MPSNYGSGLRAASLLSEIDPHILEEQDITAYFTHVVQGLLQEHLETTAIYAIDGKNMEALALTDSYNKEFPIGYNYVYSLVDTVNKVRQSGIVIANPRIYAPFRGRYSRESTNRHYYEQETGVIMRKDLVHHRRVFQVPLSGQFTNPLSLKDSADDSVTREFKADMVDIMCSGPLRPLSNLLRSVVEL
jgi:hypothetical protein